MNFRFLITTVLLLSSCTRIPVQVEPPAIPSTYQELKLTYKSCRGDGMVAAKGTWSGQLRFRFSLIADTSYVEFRDLLGRSVLQLHMVKGTIRARDMLRNRTYSEQQLTSIIPVLEVFSVHEIQELLWGFVEDSTIQKDAESILVTLEIKSLMTDQGLLVKSVSAVDKLGENHLTVEIFRREFSRIYSDMIQPLFNANE